MRINSSTIKSPSWKALHFWNEGSWMKSHEEPACKDQQIMLYLNQIFIKRLVSMYSLGTFSIFTKTVSIKGRPRCRWRTSRGHCLKSALFPHAGSWYCRHRLSSALVSRACPISSMTIFGKIDVKREPGPKTIISLSRMVLTTRRLARCFIIQSIGHIDMVDHAWMICNVRFSPATSEPSLKTACSVKGWSLEG